MFSTAVEERCLHAMDSRFMAEWKIIIDGETRRRIIRMRMALRGFKDIEADQLANQSATTSRLSQRLLNSEAVVQDDFVENFVDIRLSCKGLESPADILHLHYRKAQPSSYARSPDMKMLMKSWKC